MTTDPPDDETTEPDAVPEMQLTDDDILDAMQHIPGYLDITTEDFRTIYHLAYGHAAERLFGGITAGRLMRTGISPLQPATTLDKAAKIIVDSGYKGLPVVDGDGRVAGMLTETDFLKLLQAESFLALLLKLVDDSYEFTHRCHDTLVASAMTQPAVTVGPEAGFVKIMEEFHAHPGRSMPVVGPDNRLLGLLLRRDFLAACRIKEAS